MFDNKITLARPYHLFVLHEIVENLEHREMKEIIQFLLTRLSNEHLLLASLIDRTFLTKVVALDEQLQSIDGNDPENNQELVERMKLLVQRVKKENLA